MNLTSAASSDRREPRPSGPRRYTTRRGWLLLARAGWLAVAALTVGIFVASVLAGLEYLGTACTAGACNGPQLPPERVLMLQEQGLSLGFYAAYLAGVIVVFAAVFFLTAAAIFWRRSDEPQALFCSLMLLTFGLVTFPPFSMALTEAHPAWWLPVALAGYLGQLSIQTFFYVFPDGRFVPRWTRWTAVAWGVLSFPIHFFPGSSLDPQHYPVAFVPMYVFFLGTAVFAQVRRYRNVSTAMQRQQTKWVVFGMAAAVAGFLGLIVSGVLVPTSLREGAIGFLVVQSAFYAFMLLIPLSIAVAVLRYRLWDVDPIINRTLVYGALSASVVGLYVLIVGYLAALFRAENNLAISLVATGFVAVLFQPLRGRLQRAVNRLMYGERDEPYAVISRLGGRLRGTLAPDAVLSTIVRTVKEALKLPYTAIVLTQGGTEGGTGTIAAAEGTPVDDPLRLPLVYRGEQIGQLLLSPRAPDETWSPADLRLLDDLAQQAGVAVHAVRLTTDL